MNERHRVRIRFAKEGDQRWISHRDLLRLFERLFRRANLSLQMSEGFHPKAKISFPSALALGTVGSAEIVELELAEPMSTDELKRRLNDCSPDGIRILEVQQLRNDEKKAQAHCMRYAITIPVERQQDVQPAIENLREIPTALVHREGRKEPLDAKDSLAHIELDGDQLRFSLWASRQASIRPIEILELLGVADLIEHGSILTRTQVEITSASREKSNT